nr:hypothetical protein [Escherichia coli]
MTPPGENRNIRNADSIDRRIAKQKEPTSQQNAEKCGKDKISWLEGRTSTAEERSIANALGASPACLLHAWSNI